MSRRLRELGIAIGALPTGEFNAITDVLGVAVGHTTLIYDEPRVACTGVTVVLSRPLDTLYQQRSYAGYFSFNGNGEMTGVHWLGGSDVWKEWRCFTSCTE
jgi:D-aminopeptidase